MKPIVGALSAIAMSLPIAVEACQADLGTPRQQFSAIIKEYNPGYRDTAWPARLLWRVRSSH